MQCRASGHYLAVGAGEQTSAVEIAHSPLYGVLRLKAVLAVIEHPAQLGDRQAVRVFLQNECEDDTLCFAVGVGRAAIRRVGISHGESTLLVVRRPVVCKHFGSPLLGAGSQLPFPLRPDWVSYAGRHGAGDSTRAAPLMFAGEDYQLSRYALKRDTRQTPHPQPALGKAIRQLRRERGASLESLAPKAGLALNTLSLIELGQANPTWETVKGIAAALEVSIADIATLSLKFEDSSQK